MDSDERMEWAKLLDATLPYISASIDEAMRNGRRADEDGDEFFIGVCDRALNTLVQLNNRIVRVIRTRDINA
jgi:hypothetical protein